MEAAAGRAAGIGWETGPGVRAEVGGKVGIGGGGWGDGAGRRLGWVEVPD
jgi:hypothetical protein